MASYELYTYCWDGEGQEVDGFTIEYEGDQMDPYELADWAKEEARKEIKSQGGDIFHEEGNLIQYKMADGEYNEYLWVHGIEEEGNEWDLEVS